MTTAAIKTELNALLTKYPDNVPDELEDRVNQIMCDELREVMLDDYADDYWAADGCMYTILCAEYRDIAEAVKYNIQRTAACELAEREAKEAKPRHFSDYRRYAASFGEAS